MKASLLNAAEVGDIVELKHLLAAGAVVDVCNDRGESPVWICSARGHLHCLIALIDAGGNVNLTNYEDQGLVSPLTVACASGNVQCVDALIQRGRANVDVYDAKGNSPVSRCASLGHVDCLRLLIRAGANVNCTNKSRATPLHNAAVPQTHRCDVEVIELLVNAGANVNAGNLGGMTPLRLIRDYREIGKRGVGLLISNESVLSDRHVKYPSSVFDLILPLVPTDVVTSSTQPELAVKAYFLNQQQSHDGFMYFALGAHDRAGKESPVKRLVRDVMGCIYDQLMHFDEITRVHQGM